MKGAPLTISFLLHAFFFSWLLYGAFVREAESVALHVEFKQGATPRGDSRFAAAQSASRANGPAFAPGPSLRAVEKSNVTSSVASGSAITILGSSIGINATYPRLSRVLRETGVTVVTIRKESSGDGHYFIAKSSGYVRLDESALRAAQDAFDRGLLKPSFERHEDVNLSFIFKLTE